MLAYRTRFQTGLFVLSLGLFALNAPATAQDIGDLLNQFAGESSEEEAPPQSPIDVLESETALTKLDLNKDQRDKIKTIIEGYREQVKAVKAGYDEQLKALTSIGEKLRKRAEFRGKTRAENEEKKKAAEQALLDLLNDQQKAELKTMVPEPPAESLGPGSSNTNPSVTSTPSRSTAPAKRTANTVASFGAADDSPPQAKPSTAATSGNAAPPAKADQSGNATLEFNFQEAPWTDVLRLFAKAARLTLNMRDVPPGSFTYYDDQKYTSTEALDVMNRMLLQSGYILVRHDRFLSVFNASKGVPPNLVETVTPDELPKRGKTELLRVALPLGDRDIAKATSEVQGLLGPQGKVAPLESANSIIVTDIAANLIRVEGLLKGDAKVGDDKLTFKAFQLKQIDAAEAAEIIRSLLGVDTGVTNVSEAGPRGPSSSRGSSSRGSSSSRGTDPRAAFIAAMRGGGTSSRTPAAAGKPPAAAAKVAVDYRTNSVLVNATAANMKLVEEMVKALDVESADVDGVVGGRSSREPYLQVYKIKNAETTEVSKTLTVLHPGLVVNEDGRYKTLHIMANAEEHNEIAGHIRQLDGGGTGDTLAVLPLEGLNGYNVSMTVEALYENDKDSAPSIQMDPSRQSVIVRGDAIQIQMVRTMISRLAEQGPSTEPSPGRSVRIVAPGAASTDYLQNAIGVLYPQVTFTAAEAKAKDNSQDSRNSRSSGSSSADADRERRIREWRERMFSRGGSSGGFGGSRGSSRGSSPSSSSGRPQPTRGR